MAGYGWIVGMLSFLVNFLLILCANHLCDRPPDGIRGACAALLSGVQAGCCMLHGFSFLGDGIWRVVFSGLTVWIAFGFSVSGWKAGGLYLLLRAALQVITADGAWSMILAAVVMFLLCVLGRRHAAPTCVPVTITHGGRTLHLIALVDTGNTLKDPITGASVLVVDGQAGWQLLSLGNEQLAHPLETMVTAKIPGLRLIPYSAVGQLSGLLLGMKVDQLIINGNPSDAIVAFAPQRIGAGSGFRALAGGMV